MTVKEIAVLAAALLQADDLEAIFESGEVPTDRDALTLTKCVELAACETGGDFPVSKTQTLVASSGRIPFSAFGRSPSSVLSVRSKGKRVKFRVEPDGIRVGNGTFEVEYAVMPETKESGEIEIGAFVTRELLAYLAARNFCLITGRADEASIWDQRYNAEAEKRRIKRRAEIPARVWR